MAPPRIIKKSTTTERTIRRGSHSDRSRRIERVIEEVDEETADDIQDALERSSQDSSQDMEVLLKEISDAQRKRRQARRNKILTAHAQSVTDARSAITSLFDTHEQEATKSRTEQLAHLQELFRLKADCEKAIDACMAGLNAACDMHAKELEYVLKARSAELTGRPGPTTIDRGGAVVGAGREDVREIREVIEVARVEERGKQDGGGGTGLL